MAYKTIHTNYGLQQMAAAEALGTSINLVAMAVGDGNGNPTTPSQTQANLARELYRATVNRVFQDPANPMMFTAEIFIPASIGGFTMREVGIFDASGALFAVANLPDVYKPTASEGAFSDAFVRMQFEVTNANVVTIIVDPNVAVASHTWVINNITPAFLLPGGTTGQVLTKASNADGDVLWGDPDVASVVVDVIEERQTLAAAQTTVTLAVVTTRGLAVYIEGVRIPKGAGVNEWREDATSPDTKIVLGQAYPVGTAILLTQNEPAGNVPFPLVRSLNLSDVPDPAAARGNLGVYSQAEADTRGKQPGDIFYTARSTAPARSLKANGAAVSRTAYAALFAAIGTRFGAGDGFNTFNLPELRGESILGWDDGRGIDPGRVLGSWKAGQNARHSHTGTTQAAGEHSHTTKRGDFGSAGVYALRQSETTQAGNEPTSPAGSHFHQFTTHESGGNEVMTRGLALLACIAY